MIVAPVRTSRADGRVAGLAAADLARALLVRCVVAAAAVPLLLWLSWWLYTRSMRSTLWGPYDGVPQPVPVDRYSTLWLVSAAGVALLAGLLLTSAVADVVRVRRIRRSQRRSAQQHPGTSVKHLAGSADPSTDRLPVISSAVPAAPPVQAPLGN